jgi:hypothetical protein
MNVVVVVVVCCVLYRWGAIRPWVGGCSCVGSSGLQRKPLLRGWVENRKVTAGSLFLILN